MAEDFDIESTHPDYDAFAHSWTVMQDTYDGEDVVKAKGEVYLPMKSGIKAMSDERKKQAAYDAYRCRAEFPELVAPTVRGSVGLIHDKTAVIELPSAMEYLREKATSDGLTLEGLHNKITTELMKCGRYGLLPGVKEDGTFHIAGYPALAITNWDSDSSGVLDFLTLDESGPQRDPSTNKWDHVTRYRECVLSEGAYVSREWEKIRDSATGKSEYDVSEPISATIRGQDGLPMIPFVFINCSDLTPTPDDVPLYGLARISVRIYRLDADYVNSLHMTSEPTPWVSGVAKDAAPSAIGAAVLWVLEASDAKCGMLEFSGQGIGAQEKAIMDAYERAVMFGAQVLSDKRRTAESGDAIELRLRYQTSTIKSIAMASAAGLEQALRNIAVWSGLDPDQVTVTPNLDFVDRALGPQEITALVDGWMKGAYSKRSLFANLQRGEIIHPDKTFEDEEEEISDEGPALSEPPPVEDDGNEPA